MHIKEVYVCKIPIRKCPDHLTSICTWVSVWVRQTANHHHCNWHAQKPAWRGTTLSWDFAGLYATQGVDLGGWWLPLKNKWNDTVCKVAALAGKLLNQQHLPDLKSQIIRWYYMKCTEMKVKWKVTKMTSSQLFQFFWLYFFLMERSRIRVLFNKDKMSLWGGQKEGVRGGYWR